VKEWVRSNWFRTEQNVGVFINKFSEQPIGSVEGGNFLTDCDYYILKEDRGGQPWSFLQAFINWLRVRSNGRLL
jgi:hypothetical protein